MRCGAIIERNAARNLRRNSRSVFHAAEISEPSLQKRIICYRDRHGTLFLGEDKNGRNLEDTRMKYSTCKRRLSNLFKKRENKKKGRKKERRGIKGGKEEEKREIEKRLESRSIIARSFRKVGLTIRKRDVTYFNPFFWR